MSDFIEQQMEAESNQFIGWYDGFHGRDKAVDELHQEIARLREALENIGKICDQPVRGGDPYGPNGRGGNSYKLVLIKKLVDEACK